MAVTPLLGKRSPEKSCLAGSLYNYSAASAQRAASLGRECPYHMHLPLLLNKHS